MGLARRLATGQSQLEAPALEGAPRARPPGQGLAQLPPPLVTSRRHRPRLKLPEAQTCPRPLSRDALVARSGGAPGAHPPNCLTIAAASKAPWAPSSLARNITTVTPTFAVGAKTGVE